MAEDIDLRGIFSSNIKKLRTDIGWNQAELARQSDLSRAAISQLENGGRGPTKLVTGKIADALGVDISVLFQQETDEAVDNDKDVFYGKYRELRDLSPENQQMILQLARKLKETQESKD